MEVPADVHVPARSGQLPFDGVDRPRAAVRACPKIRPGVVERGRRLAADPGYPSIEIIWHIGAQIVRSVDPAGDPG